MSGTLIDLASNRQINRSIATNKTYNYKLNDNIIKTNGCWVFSVVLNRNIVNNDSIELYTGDSSTCELCVNDFQLRLATGSPNISEVVILPIILDFIWFKLWKKQLFLISLIL